MRLAALAAFVVIGLVRPALADDRWMGWQTLPDGQSNGIEVSYRPAQTNVCGKGKPWVAMSPRFRNNYTERVAGTLEAVYAETTGTRTSTTTFELAPGETKVIEGGAICHNTNQSLKLAIVGFRFPDRDAEQKKIAEQKAAADKAAADKAAAQKAAADKAAAEQRAADEARRKQLAEHHDQATEAGRQIGEHEARKSQAEADENERKRIAALEQEQAAQAARERVAASRKAQLSDLRRGEFSVRLPTGFERVDYASVSDNGLLFGVRAEVRGFAWWAADGERVNPSGTGVEFALAAGYAKITNNLASMDSPVETSLTNVFSRVRLWHGPLALGAAVEWTRYSHADSGAPSQDDSLVSLSPEVAFGLLATKLVAVELGARIGAVGTSLGNLSFSASNDLYTAAYADVAINYIYAGATAMRYLSSSGNVGEAWNAMGAIGFRVPF
ncbi:MAG TPA: hypothetical protein VFV99_05170 [Kofleriaceae bacterium]|nr:hypothetical protein [Kofleriaceae bacterium]